MNEKDNAVDQNKKKWINQDVKFSVNFSLEFPRWFWMLLSGLMLALIVLW